MTPGPIEFPPWVSPTLLAAASLCGLWVFRCLFWDWLRRGRLAATRRCPKCWYDMTGAGLVCPECGRVARKERDLHRSRRRWAWAVVLTLAGTAALAARWADGKSMREMARGLPTDALLLLVREPAAPSSSYAFGMGGGSPPALSFQTHAWVELLRRDWMGTTSDRQRRWLAHTQFAKAPPVTLVVRPRWPRGVPMMAECTTPFGGVRSRDLRATSPWAGSDVLAERSPREGWSDDLARRYGPDWEYGALPGMLGGDLERTIAVRLGTPPAGAVEAGLDVEVREDDLVVWTGRVTAPVQLVDGIDEAITPEVDENLTAALRQAFATGFVVHEGGRSVEMAPITIPTERVMAAVRVEIVKDGAVLASCSVMAGQSELPSRNPAPWARPIAPPQVYYSPLRGPGVPCSREDLKGATLRITPDKDVALYAVEWSRYWTGMIEVPLDPDRQPAPRPAW